MLHQLAASSAIYLPNLCLYYTKNLLTLKFYPFIQTSNTLTLLSLTSWNWPCFFWMSQMDDPFPVKVCKPAGGRPNHESHLMYPLYLLKLYVYRLKVYLIPSTNNKWDTLVVRQDWIPPKWSPPFFYWAWEAAAESEHSKLLLPKHLGQRCRYTVCGKPHPDLTLCTKRKRIFFNVW